VRGAQEPVPPHRMLAPVSGRSHGVGGTAARIEQIIAEAEHAADEIRLRAATDAKRARSRAAEESRAALMQARRDILEMMKRARRSAHAIVVGARQEEARLNARMRRLRGVVEETEELLVSLALRPQEAEDGSNADDAADLHIVLAAEQARIERRWRDQATRDQARLLPESVRRLLLQLKSSAG
jgi:hypothetical protein